MVNDMKYLTLALALALLLSTPSFGNGGHPAPVPTPTPAPAPTLAATTACGFICWLPMLIVGGFFAYIAYTHNEWCEQNPGKCNR
jgi:hypothetical protein